MILLFGPPVPFRYFWMTVVLSLGDEMHPLMNIDCRDTLDVRLALSVVQVLSNGVRDTFLIIAGVIGLP